MWITVQMTALMLTKRISTTGAAKAHMVPFSVDIQQLVQARIVTVEYYI